MSAPQSTARSLELMLLQAHRAKGLRYANPSKEKDCFRTWYSYALRAGGAEKARAAGGGGAAVVNTRKEVLEHGRYLREIRERAPGGRTYL